MCTRQELVKVETLSGACRRHVRWRCSQRMAQKYARTVNIVGATAFSGYWGADRRVQLPESCKHNGYTWDAPRTGARSEVDPCTARCSSPQKAERAAPMVLKVKAAPGLEYTPAPNRDTVG